MKHYFLVKPTLPMIMACIVASTAGCYSFGGISKTSNVSKTQERQWVSASTTPPSLTLPPIRSVSDFRSALKHVRSQYALPAVAAAVITPSGITYMDAVGTRSTATRKSVQLTDKFHLGSNGKALTGFLAARLVESGIITWQTKVLDVFPEFRSDSHHGYEQTTLQDVLAHRSGVPSMTALRPGDTTPGFDNSTPNSPREKRLELVHWMLQQSPKYDSGALFTYSNAGYALAAAMMERITNKSWESLLEHHVWQPLGIKANIGWAFVTDTTQPFGHMPLSKGFVPQSLQYQLPVVLDPAGNISISLPDYAKFVQANLNGFQGQAPLLRAEAYQFLLKGFPGYSIGWGVKQDPKYGFVNSHNGSAGTFLCHASLLHDKGAAIVIMMNAGGPQAKEAMNALREHLWSFIERKSNKQNKH